MRCRSWTFIEHYTDSSISILASVCRTKSLSCCDPPGWTFVEYYDDDTNYETSTTGEYGLWLIRYYTQTTGNMNSEATYVVDYQGW
jgi:hypothetical protein